jgi:hypothetical protein
VTRVLLDREATLGRAPDDVWLPRWLGEDRSAVVASTSGNLPDDVAPMVVRAS